METADSRMKLAKIFRVPLSPLLHSNAILFSRRIPRVVRVNRHSLFVKIAGLDSITWTVVTLPPRRRDASEFQIQPARE